MGYQGNACLNRLSTYQRSNRLKGFTGSQGDDIAIPDWNQNQFLILMLFGIQMGSFKFKPLSFSPIQKQSENASGR